MNDLILTLGHNSSAIYILDGKIICGYEHERITGIKSDSSYPQATIDMVMRRFGVAHFDRVYISHWFNTFELTNNKYLNLDHVKQIGSEIISLTKDFTHHDAHHKSSVWFSEYFDMPKNSHSLVMDGFGSVGECISLYDVDNNMLFRAFGYSKSLGLLFQYTTAFLGLKMHQDEYKLLGYETHIDLFEDFDIELVNYHAKDIASEYYNRIIAPGRISRFTDPIVNANALSEVKAEIFSKLSSVCTSFDIDNPTTHDARIIFSAIIQQVIEIVALRIVKEFKIYNVILSGGVFMNVKLNRVIVNAIKGAVCINPLAGDAGAGLGLYYHHNKSTVFPGHLYWGLRFLDYDNFKGIEGIRVVRPDQAIDAVIIELTSQGWVNVVHGAMEYGPRALGHTTTYAVPTMYAIEAINKANNRSTIMPMAPIMTDEQASNYLANDELSAIYGSTRFMACTVLVNPEYVDLIKGAAHRYPSGYYTARPQTVSDKHSFEFNLLETFGIPLINTSFNYHGQPIVFDESQIIYAHNAQRRINPHATTIIIKD